MRVLQVNKYYYVRSGTERYLFNLTRLLEERGHQVIPFAMHHPRNTPTPYDRYFVEPMDFHRMGWHDGLRAVQRVIYYRSAAQHIAALLEETKPDVVHLHNIYHHISPAILPEIARRGLPIIHSLHDYQRICPSYALLANGAPCERCRGHHYYQAPLRRCLHGSLSWSLLAGLAAAIHHGMCIYERHVRRSIVPTQFVWNKMCSFGIDSTKLTRVPYFLFPQDFEPRFAPGQSVVYFGRLSHEKGLLTLLQAMRQLPHQPLVLAGEGPQRAELERIVTTHGLSNVQFVGYLAGEHLHEAIRSACLVVAPSEWYEPFGQVVIEAFALGKPVAVARSGGLTELIDDDVDGCLFTPGDANELAATIAHMTANPTRLANMGRAGRHKVEQLYGPATHYTALMAMYRQAGYHD